MDDIKQSTSPVMSDAEIVVDETMTFPEAMIDLISGKSIKRKEWGEIDEYGLMKDGWMMIHKADSNRFDIWKVSEADLLAEDWFVLK